MAKGKAKPKFKKRNLISLVWPVNTCYSHLQAGVPKGVTVDLIKGTWTFQGDTLPIGSSRRNAMDITGDPIGVYDRTKIEHLEAMKDDSEWVKTRHGPPGD